MNIDIAAFNEERELIGKKLRMRKVGTLGEMEVAEQNLTRRNIVR
jgi:hypothetical protein